MAFTRVLGPGIHTASNINSHNINSTGIITAVSFVGDGSGLTGVASTDNIVTGTAATFNTYPVDINAGMTVAGVSSFSGAISGTTANFSGNVTVGGVLTYEDVKNVDSLGIITARSGVDVDDFLDVGSNIKLGNAGVITATTFKGDGDFVELDVDGHTNLDNVSIAGFTTIADASSTTGRLYFGDDQDMQMWHSGSDGVIYNNTGSMYIGAFSGNGITIQSNRIYLKNGANNETYIDCYQNARVGLYFNNEEKLRTIDKGIQVGTGVTIETNGQATYTGIVTATAFKLASGLDVGTGAGGTWSTYTAGIATSKSVGVNTSTLDDNDLVGVGNSFQGLYISNGMMIMDNTLSGNHFIGTSFNGLMAGPVNIEGTLTIDGNYVVV